MKKNDTPENARIALQTGTAAVCRHGPKGEVEVLCLATRMENGIWASVRDRGIYASKVRGQSRGLLEVVDLHLHTLEDDLEARSVHPIRWATQTPIDPIVLLGVPGDTGDTPFIVPSGELVVPEYQHIHVPVPYPLEGDTFFGPRHAAQIDLKRPFGTAQGSIFGPPMLQSYRTGMEDAYRPGVEENHRDSIIESVRRRSTMCVLGDMGRPHDSLLGAPVVESSGRLAGVVVGAGQGFQYDHVGSYVPADVLSTVVQLAKAQWAAAWQKGRHAFGIDIVSHESTDVYWKEEDRPREPRHYLDMPVKVVMPRRRLRDIVAAADEGLGDGKTPLETASSPEQVGAAIEELRGIIAS